MKRYSKSLLAACLIAVAASEAIAQTDPYKPPLYWSAYEYNIVRQHIGVCYNYLPEYELQANIDWVAANLQNLGYDTIEVDGWGDSLQLNQNGYRASHSQLWEHDFSWWSAYLQSRGMRLGMYSNPLWIHVKPSDTHTKIVGTDINVSSLIDTSEITPTQPSTIPTGPSRNPPNPKAANSCGVTGSSPGNTSFAWVQVERPGAEQYVKGYIKYYADMGIKFLRVDFLAWYETGFDHYLGRVGVPHSHQDYVTALRWMREACDQYGVYLSITMANLFNEAEVERQYAHSVRVDEDVDYGEWYKFSDKDRGQRFPVWSQYANAFDGFSYWSYLSGQNRMRLDGDFIRMNTYTSDSERRTVISTHLIAGGLVGVTDQYNSIGNNVWAYQNQELLALNTDDFVGHPLTNDPTNQASQIWTGRMSNGDAIVGLFNRELTPTNRSLSFSNIGLQGNVAVRDLWQHADLGLMSSINVQLPPHGSMVLKLTQTPSTCRPQSITFNPIADWTNNSPPATLSASATSGLPVQFEVALGPATVEGNQVQPTNQSGMVYVVAKQAGDSVSCAAIPQVQSFNATGVHQKDMFLFGTFTSWTPVRMRLEGDTWIADNVWVAAGAQQYKFANTNNFTGADWGNGQGLTAIATVTTGGGPNSQLNAPENGFYTASFNDVTLEYAWELELLPSAGPQ
jgi:Alpha galactosidase C-terminal beta sandwich domain